MKDASSTYVNDNIELIECHSIDRFKNKLQQEECYIEDFQNFYNNKKKFCYIQPNESDNHKKNVKKELDLYYQQIDNKLKTIKNCEIKQSFKHNNFIEESLISIINNNESNIIDFFRVNNNNKPNIFFKKIYTDDISNMIPPYYNEVNILKICGIC